MLLAIENHLGRRLVRFKSATGRTRCGELAAHLLQARSKRFNLLLQTPSGILAFISGEFRKSLANLSNQSTNRE